MTIISIRKATAHWGALLCKRKQPVGNRQPTGHPEDYAYHASHATPFDPNALVGNQANAEESEEWV